MTTTNTTEQTHETCVPTWYGQHLERATVLNTAHIATVNAALVGIQSIADLLHDREAQRCAGEATHCPTKNMGLLAAIHSLATLVQLHTNEDAEELPAFIRDTQGVQEVRSATYSHWIRSTTKRGKSAEWAQAQQAQHLLNQQPNQPQTHAQQAQAATETVAKSGSKGGRHGL